MHEPLRLTSGSSAPAQPQDSPHRPWRMALAIILLFFGAGGVWASMAPLASSVVASGLVQPEGRRRPVQSSAAGVLAELKVRDGQPVRQGDVLAVLEDVRDRAEADAALQQVRQLAAQEARLEAERMPAGPIRFPHPTLQAGDDPAVAAILRSEIAHLEARRAADATRRSIMDQRIVQLNAQIEGSQIRLRHTNEQLALIREEITDIVQLVQRGLAVRPRLLELQRRQADLNGTIGEITAGIARLRENIGETQLQATEFEAKKLEDVTAQLVETQTRRRVAEERLVTATDKLTKTEIRATASGLPINLKYTAPGAVVSPGEVLVEIVPQDDDVFLEVRLRPLDIDAVTVGSPARVLFMGPANGTMRTVTGRLVHVAPDVIADPQGQVPYYRAMLTVARADLTRELPELRPMAGMPVQTFIDGPHRTLVQYLAKPITKVFLAGMRER